MPHNSHQSHSGHAGSSGDDLGSTDEVKIFKDEGDREDEKISSENLLEEKSSLIDLTESEEKSGKVSSRQDHSPVFGKVEPHASSFNMGYLVSPYSYTNGAAGGLPVSMANKMGLSPFFCHNGDPLTTPPPAHCGIPPYQLDPKAMGLTRPTIYSFPPSQYPYPMLSPDMSQVASWHTPSVYSAASSFRSPYPSSLPINTSDFSFRFSPSLLPSVHTPPHHVLNSHPAIVTPGPKQEIGQDANHRYRTLDQKNSPSVQSDNSKDNSNEKKKPHIKKPLNAFMLYMKEMRAKVVAECTLKESAAINQILGRRWHALGREEQAKYYELARRERQLHMQMYPDWSSRTNASRGKKRKRKQDTNDGGNNMKKCRARFGLDQQNQWCKPCRRKKKCIRYMEVEGEENSTDLDNHVSDDNLGSCGSVDDVKTPEDDAESLNQSLSSPGCLSGLSSLQSPSTSLASPQNLLTSPSTPLTILQNSSHQEQQQQQPHQQHTQQQQQHSTIFSSSTADSNHSNSNSHHPTTIKSSTSSGTDSIINHLGKDDVPPTIATSLTSTSSSSSGSSTSSSGTPTPTTTSSLIPANSISTSSSSTPSSTTSSSSSSSTVPFSADIFFEKAIRSPVGANPHDINNPLSINQLTKRDYNVNTLLHLHHQQQQHQQQVQLQHPLQLQHPHHQQHLHHQQKQHHQHHHPHHTQHHSSPLYQTQILAQQQQQQQQQLQQQPQTPAAAQQQLQQQQQQQQSQSTSGSNHNHYQHRQQILHHHQQHHHEKVAAAGRI